MKTTDTQIKGILRFAAMATVIMAAIGTGTAGDATVIHYDGDGSDYVNGTRLNLHGGFMLPAPMTDGLVRTWQYDETVPISPSSPSYTGPSLYAALQMTGVSAAVNFNPNSGILTGSLTPGPSSFALVSGEVGGTFTAMVFIKPDVDGGNTVSFDSESSISLYGTGVADDASMANSIRFVVQNSGKWYISSTPVYTGSSEWTLSNVGSAMFALFDPTGAVLPEVPKSGYDHAGSSFTNITAVGYYADSLTRANNAAYFTMNRLTVNATVTAGAESATEADAAAADGRLVRPRKP